MHYVSHSSLNAYVDAAYAILQPGNFHVLASLYRSWLSFLLSLLPRPNPHVSANSTIKSCITFDNYKLLAFFYRVLVQSSTKPRVRLHDGLLRPNIFPKTSYRIPLAQFKLMILWQYKINLQDSVNLIT